MRRRPDSTPLAGRWLLSRPLLLPLAVVVVSITALWLTTPLRERMVANQLAEQLVSAEPPRIQSTLRALVELDASGLPALASLLDSPDPAVVTATTATLDRLIQNWRLRGASHWSPRVKVLVETLAHESKSFRPAARRQAAIYAAELLQWPTTDETVDRVDILVACDHVLRVGQSARVAEPTNVEPNTVIGRGVDSTSSDVASPRAVNAQIERFAALPGGGLPVDVATMPDLPRKSTIRTATAPQATPRPLPPRHEARPIEPQRKEPIQEPNSHRAEHAPRPWRDTRHVAAELREVEAPSVTLERVQRAPSRSAPQRNAALASRSTRAIIGLLVSENEEVVGSAEHELVYRGLSVRELQLARNLATADAVTRREMAAALPGLPDIDARRWLLWFTEDDDAETRLLAYRWLTTTGDIVLLKQIRAAARQDPDLRIRRLAAEMSAGRRRLR